MLLNAVKAVSRQRARSDMKIRHWHYNDGYRIIPEVIRKAGAEEKEFEEDLVGWHCWAYPEAETEYEFRVWLRDNIKGRYDCDWRFNGGDAMYTIRIRNDDDATLFKLRWM